MKRQAYVLLTSMYVSCVSLQAANIPPELMDGPLVAMARRSDCDAALQSRASAHLMPPLDPRRPSSTLEVAGEDVYIQQLQAVINRYEQQSAAPYCAEVWALKGAPSARRGAGGVQQEAPEKVNAILAAWLRGKPVPEADAIEG